MVEEQIVSGCLRGESTARQELYNMFAGRLLFLCQRYVADRATAEDILHDAFIKIFGSLHTFSWRGKGSLRAWVERVTINMALEHLRHNNKMSFISIDTIAPICEEPSPEQTSRISPEKLKQLVEELPDGYRTIFNLYCIEEYSHKEIANMLGINEKSSSSQLFRAKAMLAQKIKSHLV